jgi:hypothetical protein
MDALAAAHDAAVQMIDTSIVRVHQHGACILRRGQSPAGVERSKAALLELIGAEVAGLASLSGGCGFLTRQAPCRDGHKGLLGLHTKCVLRRDGRIAIDRLGAWRRTRSVETAST